LTLSDLHSYPLTFRQLSQAAPLERCGHPNVRAHVRIDVVLVAKKALAVLFRPAGVAVLLAQFGWFLLGVLHLLIDNFGFFTELFDNGPLLAQCHGLSDDLLG
jgi:hypothetical protein